MNPSQGISKLCSFFFFLKKMLVYMRQLIAFLPRLSVFYISGTLCYPSVNGVLGGQSALKARSARWWHNVHQEVLEQNFSHFF